MTQGHHAGLLGGIPPPAAIHELYMSTTYTWTLLQDYALQDKTCTWNAALGVALSIATACARTDRRKGGT